jgi:hypothetical protein
MSEIMKVDSRIAVGFMYRPNDCVCDLAG